MKKLDRYILGEFLAPLALVVLGLASLMLLVQVVEKLMGQPLPEAVRARLPDQVHVTTVTRWRIDRASGVVRWMERVESRSILGADDRNVLTMTRRPG